jgi:hypothetical protein
MRFRRAHSCFAWPVGAIFVLLLLLGGNLTALAACTQSITSGDWTGPVGVAMTYPIVATGNPRSYNALNLPASLTVDQSTGVISGIPIAPGTYSVTLQATYQGGSCGTISKIVNFNVSAPVFAGFRLPDFQTPPGTGYTPRLMLQVGANGTGTTSNRFNATLEVDVSGNGTAWVPYNHFSGITDPTYLTRDGWITDAPMPVRDSSGPTGVPQAFTAGQLTESQPPGPAAYLKADPRATRFGIFQMDTNPTGHSRIMESLWPANFSGLENGYGGNIHDTGGPVEHAPNRFSGAAYYPATFTINGSADARDTATTTYADNDSVTRPADARYANTTYTGYGSSTPYNTTVYRPIILNRPFRNVAELGYAFRDLPWKTLDFFTDKSADAGLLDIFCIHDGPQVLDGSGSVIGMAPPTTVAGKVSSNSNQAADLQPVLAGAILNELDSTNTVAKTDTGATSAPEIAAQIVTATSTTPMQNKSELITRANLPTTILPTASNDNQAVKARREVVARAASSVSQSRVWNLVIDLVAQSGHYKPNATSLQNDFVVEGEQHYWVHVAIDRFTGQVLDKQIEVVNE